MSLSLSILALFVIGVIGLVAGIIDFAQRVSLRRGLEDPEPLFDELRADVTQDRSVSAIMGVVRYGTPAGRIISAGLERLSDGRDAAGETMKDVLFAELAASKRTAAWLALTILLVGLLGLVHTGLNLIWLLGRTPAEWSFLPAAIVVMTSVLVCLWAALAHGRLLRLQTEVLYRLEAVRQRTLLLIEIGTPPEATRLPQRPLARRV